MLDQIQNDLKQAQLSRNEAATSTLRLLLSEIKNLQIQKGDDFKDEDVLFVIRKEIKKRQEAADSFSQVGRFDVAEKERSEKVILEKYLPTQLSDEELTKIVEHTINEVSASSISDMGRVISQVMAKVGQGADGGRVSGLIKQKLQAF